MRKIKLLSLVLALALVLPVLFACGGQGPSANTTEPNGTTPVTPGGAHWAEEVDFEDQELIMNISVFEPHQQTFESAQKYVRGPDKIGSDAVENMVYNRNKNLERQLGLKVTYQETNLSVSYILAEIEKIVRAANEDSPDIFNNDIYDTTHAMLAGLLWNVKDPTLNGETLDSYFNFDHPCWRGEYMQDLTMNPEKMYVLVGDAFIDVIRFAFCLYVNMGLFDETFAGGDGFFYGNVESLYGEVLDGTWTYDLLEFFLENGFRDTNTSGVAEPEEDDVVGMVFSSLAERAFLWTSGVSIVNKDENGNYSIVENNTPMFALSGRFTDIYNTPGVYRATDSLECTTLFLDNNVLFTMSMLGELESETVRDADIDKGLVPLPKFDDTIQDDYHTLIHDQAEVACILQVAGNFSAASAYLQMMNEESVPILEEYYEKTLKIRMNDNKATREMITLIHDKIDSPFDSLLARLVCSGQKLPSASDPDTGANLTPTTGTELYDYLLKDAQNKSTSFQSSYDAAVDRWKNNLKIMMLAFQSME